MSQRNKQPNPEGEKPFHTQLDFQQLNGMEEIRREETAREEKDKVMNIRQSATYGPCMDFDLNKL